ncbi:hypothetical protein Rctr197k_089 [Virus Rctr197k]|nr:hypothetical protein Rctr197k_089 [Virus Rctr197k]
MSIRKGKAYTITFAAVDPTDRPTRATGVTFGAGESRISQDGGAFSNTTNLPAEIGAGRYSLALTALEMAADNIHLYFANANIDPVDITVTTGGQPTAVVVANGGNTASTFETSLTEATNDYWKDALILFTTGGLSGQVKKISAYDGTTKFVTTTAAFTAAPAGGDRFVLINL